MSYLHIDNLYKNQDIFLFKKVYVMEKIHGTSAHVQCIKGKLSFFSGGSAHNKFVEIFSETLAGKMHGFKQDIIIYGEAYGGKQQGMRDTYGDKLKFVVFDVKINDCWLNVIKAERIAKELGLEFVWYSKTSTDIEELDKFKNQDSMQAIRNGQGEGKKAEGIIIRPLMELTRNNGERIIVKHKRDDFRETKTKRRVLDPSELKVIEKAEEVAEEWVTLMRLNHVLDKIENHSIEKMKDILIAMCEDIKREGVGEIIWSKEVQKAISKKTALFYKKYKLKP